MRFISSLLVATLAATTLTTSVAAACGGYVRVDTAPRVLAVSTHGLMANGRWTNRSFVVLEQAPDLAADAPWKQLAPHSYDATRIVALARLASPMEVTLVGPSGARVVKTSKQVALSRSWQIGFDKTRVALEVPVQNNDRFTIAIAGRATDAKWRELEYAESSATTTWWLRTQGIKNAAYATLATVQGTDYEVVAFSQDDKSQLLVRQGDVQITAAIGHAVGAVTTNGRMFLVINNDGQLGTIELPAITRA
jgi:hypothetical protein